MNPTEPLNPKPWFCRWAILWLLAIALAYIEAAVVVYLREIFYPNGFTFPISDFNEQFNCKFGNEEFDTIGGMIMQHFGHMPKRDEEIHVDGFNFKVLNADSRKIHLLQLTRGEKA